MPLFVLGSLLLAVPGYIIFLIHIIRTEIGGVGLHIIGEKMADSKC